MTPSALARSMIMATVISTRVAVAAEEPPPFWAYPVAPAGTPVPPDDGTVRRVPGSEAGFTLTELRDIFEARDWFPDGHPQMPPVVAHGRKPDVLACGACHRPEGTGGPENAALAGLPHDYIVRQIADYKAGTRSLAVKERAHQIRMINSVSALTADEVEQAASYYASLKPTANIRVVETDMVPTTFIPNWFFADRKSGETEPLGQRIIEIPDDLPRFVDRDHRVGFTVHVPPGSLARGEDLVTGADPAKAPACTGCHGDTLRGSQSIPPLAGRSASYIVRQLYEFKTGIRHGSESAAMRETTKALDLSDMIAIAAYLASRTP